MWLPRQELEELEDVPDEGVTVEQVKSCTTGDFDSCSVGIIAGVLAGVGLIALFIWLWWRRRKNNKQAKDRIDLADERARQATARAIQDDKAKEQKGLDVAAGYTKAMTALLTGNRKGDA